MCCKFLPRLATGWTVRGSNPGGGGRDFSYTSVLTLWTTQPSMKHVPGHSRGLNRPGHSVNHPPSSSAEVKEIVELYVYCCSGPSWPVLSWPLSLTCTVTLNTVKELYNRCKNLINNDLGSISGKACVRSWQLDALRICRFLMSEHLRDFGLPPTCIWGIDSSGTLCNVA
jgi:hypothetical protein